MAETIQDYIQVQAFTKYYGCFTKSFHHSDYGWFCTWEASQMAGEVETQIHLKDQWVVFFSQDYGWWLQAWSLFACGGENYLDGFVSFLHSWALPKQPIFSCGFPGLLEIARLAGCISVIIWDRQVSQRSDFSHGAISRSTSQKTKMSPWKSTGLEDVCFLFK